jgi:AcrR family transcriptional regulator
LHILQAVPHAYSVIPACAPPGGIRARKKAATREALARAAQRLVSERGFAAVSVEEIAAEVDVSPRTFHNYFASKEQAVVAPGADRARRLVEALRRRPDDEPLWQSVRAGLLQEIADRDEPDPAWRAGIELAMRTPELLAPQLAAMTEVHAELTVEVARRTGTVVGVDVYPALVASAIGAVLRSSIEEWIRRDGGTPLAVLVEEALHLLTSGLPEPGR